jgi:hypothetical protein
MIRRSLLNRIDALNATLAASECAAEEDRPRREIVSRWLAEAGDELAIAARQFGIDSGANWPVSALFTAEATPIRNALAKWMGENEVRWPGAVVIVLAVPGLESELNDGLQIIGLHADVNCA